MLCCLDVHERILTDVAVEQGGKGGEILLFYPPRDVEAPSQLAQQGHREVLPCLARNMRLAGGLPRSSLGSPTPRLQQGVDFLHYRIGRRYDPRDGDILLALVEEARSFDFTRQKDEVVERGQQDAVVRVAAVPQRMVSQVFG